MFSFIGYLAIAIIKIASLAVNLYSMIVIAAAFMSWINPDPYNPIVKFIYGITNPIFKLTRKMLPASISRYKIDLSPIAILITLSLIQSVILAPLYGFALKLAGK